METGELVLDGGFAVPETNSFGQTFRDYEAESERKDSVEEFYRLNHAHQTFDFVGTTLRTFRFLLPFLLPDQI